MSICGRPAASSERFDMADRITIDGLRIASELHDFVVQEAMPGTGIDAKTFWTGLSKIVHDLAPKNRALLAKRDEMQEKIDAWHREHPGACRSGGLQGFLKNIGYLVDEAPISR
jgi:malate synthase